jgi:hypothetical protein
VNTSGVLILILLFLTSKIAKTHNTQAQNFGEIMLN